MVEYRVTNRTTGQSVDFDGCAFDRPGQPLLDAKYGYVSLFKQADAGARWAQNGMIDGLADQARDQSKITSSSYPVEWHISEESLVRGFRNAQFDGGRGASNMTVVHTPMMARGR